MRELCERRDRGCIRKPIFKLHHNCATAIPQCELGIVDVCVVGYPEAIARGLSRNGRRGSNDLRALEDAERGGFPCF
jgi:hypothetical protein